MAWNDLEYRPLLQIAPGRPRLAWDVINDHHDALGWLLTKLWPCRQKTDAEQPVWPDMVLSKRSQVKGQWDQGHAIFRKDVKLFNTRVMEVSLRYAAFKRITHEKKTREMVHPPPPPKCMGQHLGYTDKHYMDLCILYRCQKLYIFFK